MKTIKNLLIPILVLVLTGCAISDNKTVIMGPAAKTGQSDETSRRDTNLPTTVAILPFTNETDQEFAFEVVRRTMANHFATKNYRWLHWKDVDSRLAIAGYDEKKIAAMGTRELANALGVDGLIYGNITHYDKTFAGIYAQIAVGVELKFVNANSDVLWEVKNVRRSHAGGVSTSPVGLLMNALVAGKHLYGDLNLYRAADDLGRDLAKEIPEPDSLSQRAKPVITNVVHSGVGQYLKYGDKLEVGLAGDPGMKAVAVIDGIGIIDLTESAPGEYVGSVNLDKSVNLDGATVTGRLQDDFGQATSWISPYGLLTVDNTPPTQIAAVTAISRDGAVQLSWPAPPDTDVANYQVAVAKTQTGEATAAGMSQNPEYTVTGLANFEPVYILVFATDKAGNAGLPTRVQVTPAPDPRFGIASLIKGEIPAVISGVHKLTRDGNPYALRADSRIATDGVLLIGPGVEIAVSPRARLSVLGEIHIFGTPEARVRVHDASGQGFNDFLVLQGNAPVTVSGLHVEGGGIAIQVKAGSPLLADSEFIDNQFNALSISGAARPVIRNCTIRGARVSGVIVEGQAQPVFEKNRFLDNEPFHLQNGSNYQINLTGNSFDPPASTMTVLGDVRTK